MNNSLITDGIKEDRYLKAKELADRFERGVYDEIRNVFDDLVESSDLFVEDVAPDEKPSPTIGSATMATLRIDYSMSRIENGVQENPSSLTLSVGLEWPVKERQDDIPSENGSPCYVYYKIKKSCEENFEEVRQLTEDQDIENGPDMWGNNAAGRFYVTVNNIEEIREGLRKLREHFSNYGDMFGKEA